MHTGLDHRVDKGPVEQYRPDAMPEHRCPTCGHAVDHEWCIRCAQPVGRRGSEDVDQEDGE